MRTVRWLLLLITALLTLPALAEPAGPSVAFTWPDAVTWRGPGMLVVANGGQPYVLAGPVADSAVRQHQLGGDVRASPYAGMVLAVVDADYTVRASTIVSPRPTLLPTPSPSPPPVVPRRYLPAIFNNAAPS